MIGAMARPSLARLARRPRTWLTVGAWYALAVAVALTAHSRSAAHGADHVLIATYGAYVLPLLAYGLVGALVGWQSLRSSAAPAVAFGAPPVRAASAVVAVAAGACMAAGALLAAAVAVVAHGVDDPPLVRDALVSAYAGVLGGAAYGAWFSLGAAFGRRGGGRSLFLVVDWVLGATRGAGALVTPRGHVRSLLGGAGPMDLSQRTSAIALVVLALVAAALAARRARP